MALRQEKRISGEALTATVLGDSMIRFSDSSSWRLGMREGSTKNLSVPRFNCGT